MKDKQLKKLKEFPEAISDQEYWSQFPKPRRWHSIQCGSHRDYDGDYDCYHYYDSLNEGSQLVQCEDCICGFNSTGGTLNPKMSINGNIRFRVKMRRYRIKNVYSRFKYSRMW